MYLGQEKQDRANRNRCVAADSGPFSRKTVTFLETRDILLHLMGRMLLQTTWEKKNDVSHSKKDGIKGC